MLFNKDKPVELKINEKCTQCGLCTEICPSEYLIKTKEGIKANLDSTFGCIQCAHCMMVCPNNAVEIKGEAIKKEDIQDFSYFSLSYDDLISFLAQRRSVRDFKEEKISKDTIEKILQAASLGSVSVPPTEIKVLVISGFSDVQNFAGELVKDFEKSLKFINPFVLGILKPFIGKKNYVIFKEFVYSLFKLTLEKRKEDKDVLFYGAPCVILFYGPSWGDKEDGIIASTLAQAAAVSLGLGSCMIGSVPPILNSDKKLKEKYGIEKEEKVLNALILGYPKYKFLRGVRRDFREKRYFEK